MKNLFIVNYQRTIPPFILNEVSVAEHNFDNIIYVSPNLYVDNRKSVISKNVSFVIGTRWDRFLSALFLPLSFFSSKSLANIKKGFKLKMVSLSFFKEQTKYLFCNHILLRLLKKATKKYKNGLMLASWFDCSAMAVGLFCKKQSSFVPYSFAHSYEIDPTRSKFVGVSFDEIKFRNIKKVFFISTTMRDKYLKRLQSIGIVFPKEKCSIRYLGVFDNGINKENENEFKLLLSCSLAVPIKRLDRIPHILMNCNAKIKWVHLGGGPTLEIIKKQCTDLLDKKPNIKVEFLGQIDNLDVINFFRNNKVDLFINVSDSEGLPVSIMEASSFGVPVIATDVGGTKEIVDDDDGFLISNGDDFEGIARTIDDYFLSPITDVRKRRANARMKWESNFDIVKNAKEFYSKL